MTRVWRPWSIGRHFRVVVIWVLRSSIGRPFGCAGDSPTNSTRVSSPRKLAYAFVPLQSRRTVPELGFDGISYAALWYSLITCQALSAAELAGLADPPAPDPGQLRVLLLLGRLVPRPPHAARYCDTADGTRLRRGPARRLTAAGTVLAESATHDTRLGLPLDRVATLVAGMVERAPQLQALMNSVAAGCGLHLCIPN